ncbi:MAG: hypothetical protein WEB00_06135 [Dehalococcoidia bacterium]
MVLQQAVFNSPTLPWLRPRRRESVLPWTVQRPVQADPTPDYRRFRLLELQEARGLSAEAYLPLAPVDRGVFVLGAVREGLRAQHARRESLWARVRSLLVAASLASVLAVVAAIGLSIASGIGAVSVSAETMGDALPAGSLAITRPVPVDDLAVNDVIAKDGSFQRIISIDSQGGQRVASLKADAAAGDPAPVILEGTAQGVWFYLPGVGLFIDVIGGLAGLAFLAGIPIGAGLMIRRAFAVRASAPA